MPSPAAQSKENLKKSFRVYSDGSNKIPNTLNFFLKFSLRFKTHFGIFCSTVKNANLKRARHVILTLLKFEKLIFTLVTFVRQMFYSGELVVENLNS